VTRYPKRTLSRPRLQVGDRVQLKVRTMGGWKGSGTVTHVYGLDALVQFKPDDGTGEVTCVRHEVRRISGQTRA
jgi:hypothetical protein